MSSKTNTNMVAGADSAKPREATIPVFKGKASYFTWEYEFLNNLDSMKHATVAYEQPRPEIPEGAPEAIVLRAQEQQEKWDLGSGRIASALMHATCTHPGARNELIALSRRHQAEGSRKPTGRQMMNLIKQKYDAGDIIALSDAMDAFRALRIGEDEDTSEFITRFDHAAGEVVRLGGTLNDDEKMLTLKNSVAGIEAFDHLAVSLYTLRNLTFAEAHALVCHFSRQVKAARKRRGSFLKSEASVVADAKRVHRADLPVTVGLKSKREGVRCHKCGKLGHFRAECRSTRQAVLCGYCKKPNHEEKDCRLKLKAKRAKETPAETKPTEEPRDEPRTKGLTRFTFQKPEVSVIMELEGTGDEYLEHDRNKVFID